MGARMPFIPSVQLTTDEPDEITLNDRYVHYMPTPFGIGGIAHQAGGGDRCAETSAGRGIYVDRKVREPVRGYALTGQHAGNPGKPGFYRFALN